VGGVERRVRDASRERPSLQELHHDERVAILLADLMNRADVRMVQRGGGACFGLESFQRLRMGGHVIRQELEGDVAAETDVLGK
jgi:hypothetical protein